MEINIFLKEIKEDEWIDSSFQLYKFQLFNFNFIKNFIKSDIFVISK